MAGFLILSIETSTGCGSVALTAGNMQDGRLVAEFTHRPDVTHSRRLLGSIQHAMSVGEVTWEMLDGVAVSLGPGSFTGLRIGMAAAKGIALAANVPVIGVPTPHGLAAQCMGMSKQVCCILDARKGQVYAAFYRPDQINPFLAVTDRKDREDSAALKEYPGPVILALKPEELAEMINEPTWLVGPGITPYADYFSQLPLIEVAPQGLVQPRGSIIGFLAAAKLEAAEGGLESADQLRPLYVRASEAEINHRKKEGAVAK